MQPPELEAATTQELLQIPLKNKNGFSNAERILSAAFTYLDLLLLESTFLEVAAALPLLRRPNPFPPPTISSKRHNIVDLQYKYLGAIARFLKSVLLTIVRLYPHHEFSHLTFRIINLQIL